MTVFEEMHANVYATLKPHLDAVQAEAHSFSDMDHHFSHRVMSTWKECMPKAIEIITSAGICNTLKDRYIGCLFDEQEIDGRFLIPEKIELKKFLKATRGYKRNKDFDYLKKWQMDSITIRIDYNRCIIDGKLDRYKRRELVKTALEVAFNTYDQISFLWNDWDVQAYVEASTKRFKRFFHPNQFPFLKDILRELKR